MIQDKIILTLQEIRKLREDLGAIKKDLKQEDKIDDEQYTTMKQTYKEMKLQLKDFEENWKQELQKDSNYQELTKLKTEKDEQIAEHVAELYALVGELPPKPWETNMDTEDGPVRVQVEPDMRVYLIGMEEKRRGF